MEKPGLWVVIVAILHIASSTPVKQVSSRSSHDTVYGELKNMLRSLEQEEQFRALKSIKTESRSQNNVNSDLPSDCKASSSGKDVCLMNSAGLVTVEENCVFAHNKVRSFHGVPDVKWSPSLAEKAREWATHLADIGYMEHSAAKDYGENLYWWNGSYDAKQTCGNAVYDWYSECMKPRRYNYDADQNPGALHFTQLIWEETSEIGCGISRVKPGNIDYYIVCQYTPKGNWMGEFVANVPEPSPPIVYGTIIKSDYDLEAAGKCFDKYDGCDDSSCKGMFAEFYKPFCGKECNPRC